jgi:GT2 family glycosyltransferase
MTLSVIILNYKKPQLTKSCLKSIYKEYEKFLKDGLMEVIIVDNNSQDDSLKILRDVIDDNKYKHVHLIASKDNGGFGKGCNLGAKEAKGDYVLFLNNDTVVKDQGLWDMALYMEQQPHVGILGGQLRNPDGSLQTSTGKFYTPWNAFLLLIGMQKFGLLDRSPQKITEVDWVKGGLFMVRRTVFSTLHGFDENIFMYIEDMELCYRAKQKGYSVYFYPYAKVLHAEHGSTNRTFAIVNIYQNLLYFYKKHRSRSEYLFIRSVMRAKARMLIMTGKLTNNIYLVQTYEKALKVV